MRTGLAMDGYHHTDEQLTELADDEWKSVGDVAYVDDEGYVFICDRKKDMIISGGVNIYPAEIEAVLYAHPQILDAAVFGVPERRVGRERARDRAAEGRARRSTSTSCARSPSRGSRATSSRANTRSAPSSRAPTPASC